MSRIWNNLLNIVFITQLVIVGLVITGIIPRVAVLYFVVILAAYILLASLENASIFFIRSIPFFIAIPLTPNFDSLNTWRILSGLIFLKWLARSKPLKSFLQPLLLIYHDRDRLVVFSFWKNHKAVVLLAGVLLFAVLSITQAQSWVLATKRIIYFINLSLIGIIIYDLASKNRNFSQRLIKNIAIPTIIVAVIGLFQLISTYYMDIFQFVDFWGGIVQRNLFGNAWADTALKANTWFAYFGDQLSLRMFSIFADSHSFPIFLLLGLPAVFAVSIHKVIQKGGGFRTMILTRSSLLVVFVPIIFLTMILTGTRGIWAASAGALLVIFGIMYLLRKRGANIQSKNIFKYVASYIALFFILFGVAYPIFASNEFEVSKSNSALLAKRVRSIIDISETSNSQRIQIWKASIKSIIKHPFLGVGIGNFPVVLGQDLALAKAGSSAHNLYLNIAAEMGIPALILSLWFLWLLMKKTYLNFLKSENSKFEIIYFASSLIFIPWILLYSLTDPAIFDERAFLLFTVTIAIIFVAKEKAQSGL